jgi:signal-transduction protein with cAMP-binding, CBS, and nucleotidyltransferase domain
MDNDFEKAIKILEKPEKLFEDLEFLIYFLQQYEELRKYFRLLNPVMQTSLCRQFSVSLKQKSEILIKQGESFLFLILVLQGAISSYDGKKFMSKIGAGKSIGEQEILKNHPSSFTYIVSSPKAVLLTLEASNFLTYLSEPLLKASESKLVYLRMLIPNLHKLSAFVLEKLMQGLKVVHYFKGETIVSKSSVCEHLLLVVEGEASLIDTSGPYPKEIMRMAKGSTFGEEGLFLNMPNDFSMNAKTDAVIVFLRKTDVLSSFPESVIRTLKANWEFKKMQRPQVQTNENDLGFPLASNYAKRKLAAIVSRSNRLSPSRLLDYHQKLYGDFKEMLTEMRDTSPKRIALPSTRRSLEERRMSFSFG